MDCFLEYENNQKVIITDRDVKKFMTPEDRIIPKDRLDQTQKINERFKRAEIGMRIANPEKVFGKVYRGKECKIFVTVDDDGTVRSAILNTKSGRLLIDTKLTDKEYASLQDDTSSRFDLTDLRRDVQTDVMNQKSLNEYDSMTRAVLQKQLPADFLENCYKKIKQTNKNVTLEKNRLGLILKIGNRRSNNYSRIYQEKSSLKFEYEMKGKSLEKSYNLLVLNNFEEMELILTKRFLSYFGKLLPLQSSYLDWLVFKLRPIRKQNNFQLGLNSDYIQSEIALNSKTLIQFIQFLNYAQNLDYTIANWDGVYYRKVTFIVRDFITYQNPTISSTNRYKLKKTKEFFRDLLTGAVIDSFQSDCFRTLIAIPRIEYEICPKQKYLIANVWMVNELFYYNYPFYFPNFFNTKLTKDQFEVRFKFIQVFSSINIEKVVWVQKFITSKLSNQRKATIKKYFIEVIELLQKYDLIENNYKYISQGNVYKTPKLDVKNISEGFVLYEKLLI